MNATDKQIDYILSLTGARYWSHVRDSDRAKRAGVGMTMAEHGSGGNISKARATAIISKLKTVQA